MRIASRAWCQHQLATCPHTTTQWHSLVLLCQVFYDAFNYGYDIPEVRPWGREVTNIPNCSVNQTWTGCEALVQGSLLLAKRITDTLNANGKIPMFANPGSFVRPVSRGKPQKIWLDEKRLVTALEGTRWQLYYEGARGESLSACASTDCGVPCHPGAAVLCWRL